jgi:hypothetical protein
MGGDMTLSAETQYTESGVIMELNGPKVTDNREPEPSRLG